MICGGRACVSPGSHSSSQTASVIEFLDLRLTAGKRTGLTGVAPEDLGPIWAWGMSSASIQKPHLVLPSTSLCGEVESATPSPSDQLACHSHKSLVAAQGAHHASYRCSDGSAEEAGRLRHPAQRAAVDRGGSDSENRVEGEVERPSARESGSIASTDRVGRPVAVAQDKKRQESVLGSSAIMLAGPSMEQRKGSTAHVPEAKSLPGFDLEQQSSPPSSQVEQSASRQRKDEEEEEQAPGQHQKPQRPPLAPSAPLHRHSEPGKKSPKLDADVDGHAKDDRDRSILAQEKMDDEDDEDEGGGDNEERRPSLPGENSEAKRPDRRPPPGTWGSHGRASSLSEAPAGAGEDGPSKGGGSDMRRQNGSGRAEESSRGAEKEEGRSPGLSGSETSGGENNKSGGGSDPLLRWGQRKRLRFPRTSSGGGGPNATHSSHASEKGREGAEKGGAEPRRGADGSAPGRLSPDAGDHQAEPPDAKRSKKLTGRMRNNSISSASAAVGGGEGAAAPDAAKGGGKGPERDREKLREAKPPLGREASGNSSSSSLAATNSAATTAVGPAGASPAMPGNEGALRDGDARASPKEPPQSGPEATWNGFHSRAHNGGSNQDENGQEPPGAAADAAAGPAPPGKRDKASERPPPPPSHSRGEKESRDGPAENRESDAANGAPEQGKGEKKDPERKQPAPSSENANQAAPITQQPQGEDSERRPQAGAGARRVEGRTEPERSTGSSSSGSGLPSSGVGRGQRSLLGNQIGGSSEDLSSLQVARSVSGTGPPAKTGKRGSRGREAKGPEVEEEEEDARNDGKKRGKKEAEHGEDAEAEDTEQGGEEEEAAEEEEKKVVRREPTRRRQPGGDKGRRGAHTQSDDKDSGKEKEKESREDVPTGSHRARSSAAQQGTASHHHLRRHHHQSERQGAQEKEPMGHHRHEPEMGSRRSQRHHEEDSKEPGDSPYRRSHHHHHPHGRGAPGKAEKGGDKAETEQEKAAAQNEKEHHEMRQFLGNSELVELPKFLLSLSRTEKEDDMMKIKGTKLPQRPKKRAKAVEKCVQRLLPGAWLVNVTRERYEVRERKVSSKKKPRGLKAMNGADSDSE